MLSYEVYYTNALLLGAVPSVAEASLPGSAINKETFIRQNSFFNIFVATNFITQMRFTGNIHAFV